MIKSDYYKILRCESTTRPFKTCILLRFLVLPICVKDFVLSVAQVPIMHYFISSLICNLFFRIEMLIIFSNLDEIEQMKFTGW